jgi:uncharacterized membrane protein HdeD (DUF308 family)
MRVLVLAAGFALSSAAFATPARADCDGNAGLCPLFFAVIVGAPLQGTHSIIFGVADVAYALDERWLPPSWAWTQLFAGTLSNGIAGVTWAAAAADEPEWIYPAAAVASFAVATWFAVHAVASLILYEPPAAGAAESRPRVFWY